MSNLVKEKAILGWKNDMMKGHTRMCFFLFVDDFFFFFSVSREKSFNIKSSILTRHEIVVEDPKSLQIIQRVGENKRPSLRFFLNFSKSNVLLTKNVLKGFLPSSFI